MDSPATSVLRTLVQLVVPSLFYSISLKVGAQYVNTYDTVVDPRDRSRPDPYTGRGACLRTISLRVRPADRMADHRLWPAPVGWPARGEHEYRNWSVCRIWNSRHLVLWARPCTVAADMGDGERISVSKSVARAPCDTALQGAGCNQVHAHLFGQPPRWAAEHTVLARSALGRGEYSS